MKRITAALAVMAGWALVSATAMAQLSPAAIATLQARAKAEGWTFTVGENSAASRSLSQLCGTKLPKGWSAGHRFDPCTPKAALPSSFDWRTQNGCTSIKDQGTSCGACWAFSTVGGLECAIKIKDHIDVDLSEQWLVNCNSDGYNCIGGGQFAYDYYQWKTDSCGGSGAVLESDVPYTGTDGTCNCPYPHHYWINTWAFIGTDEKIPSVDAMKQAIMQYGPISVSVAADDAFQAYTGGVFNACSEDEIDHAVVLVGWDDAQGTNGVWYMRNSWGPSWGESGYMKIAYNCSSIGYGACYVDYGVREPLEISPAYGLDSSGMQYGPFSPTSVTYTLTNSGSSSLPWTASKTQNWVDLSATSGTLASGASAQVTVSLNARINAMTSNNYSDTVVFTNGTTNKTIMHSVVLHVGHDYNTQRFPDGSTPDVQNQSFLFSPDGSGPGFYTVCRQTITNYPTDPSGGTALAMGSGTSPKITLSGGAQVHLYGNNYSSFYVNDSGNVSFNSGDITYLGLAKEHFSQPRVSGFLSNLFPSSSNVTWKQLSDRVAVTFANVSGNLSHDSFQMELFFNGDIRLSYLSIGDNEAIIGLSPGGGIPSDYLDSDFTGYVNCDARPFGNGSFEQDLSRWSTTGTSIISSGAWRYGKAAKVGSSSGVAAVAQAAGAPTGERWRASCWAYIASAGAVKFGLCDASNSGNWFAQTAVSANSWHYYEVETTIPGSANVRFEGNGLYCYVDDVRCRKASHMNWITTWLINGCFYNDDPVWRLQEDYLYPEADAAPRAGDLSPAGAWTAYNPPDGMVDFHKFYGSWNDHACSYAMVYVWSPVTRDVQLRFGSDDGIKVFLNGECVVNHDVYRTHRYEQDVAGVTLTAGRNRLLSKVSNGSGDFETSMRICDGNGDAITDLIYGLSPDAATPTPTNSPTSAATNTPTRTPTWTPSWTPTWTPTWTPSWTPTWTATCTATQLNTSTPSFTPTATDTSTVMPSATRTPSRTPTPSFTRTCTPTMAISTSTPTRTPTKTYTRSCTPTSVISGTSTPTPSPSCSPTPTFTPTATTTPAVGWATIVDNAQPGFSVSGTWPTSISGTDRYGADYRYHSAAPGGSDGAYWSPGIETQGWYQVAVWYSQGANRAVAVKYTVHHAAGDTEIVLNQQTNGGKWVVLGNFELVPEPPAPLSVSADTSSGYVIADAARFGLIAENPDMTMDNSDAGFSTTGSWTLSTAGTELYGADYLTCLAGTGSRVARWNFTVTYPGLYAAEVWYTAGAGNAPNANYTIDDGQQPCSAAIDQRTNGGQWRKLKEVYLVSGRTLQLSLTGAASSGQVVADAARLRYTAGEWEAVVDNTTANAFFPTGNWQIASPGGQYGTDCRTIAAGTGASNALWRPFLQMPGIYQVSVWYPGAPTRPADAHYIVGSAEDQDSVLVDQRGQGSRWVALGNYFMPAGTQGFAKLSDQATSGTVAADAVKYKYLAAPIQDFVLDNADASGFTVNGTWATTSVALPAAYHSQYRYNSVGTGADWALWSLPQPAAGLLEIFYPTGFNRAENAPFSALSGSGDVLVSVNQRIGYNRWIALNPASLEKVYTGVRLTDQATSGYVIADAVRFTSMTPR